MKKKIFIYVLIAFVVSIIIFESYSISNMLINHTKVQEDIKTVDVFNNKDKTLSIKVQSGEANDFEWYEPEDRSKWPDKTKFTYVGTKCEDANGTNIENTRQYVTFNEDRNTATITTKKTIYCTLYFGKGRPALEVLNAQGGQYYGGGTKDNRTAVQGLYRFRGTASQVTNNFVCIGGPLNPDTCGSTENNKYLYRIIGVTDGTEASDLGLEAGMLKVIKVIPTSTSQVWETDYYKKDIDWDNGSNDVRKAINGGSFLDAGIKNIIPAVYWWKGDKTSSGASETKTQTTAQYQIGLMYQSDYYNSWTYDYNKNSWLNITNTMSGKTGTYGSTDEWTMTRYGKESNYSDAWYVRSDGSLQYYHVNNTYAVRPVFYLPSTIGLVGNGIETSPYVITSLSNA